MILKHSNALAQAAIRFTSPFVGSALILLGCAVLYGWAVQSTALTSVSPLLPTMKINTAIAFVLLGIATLGLRHPRTEIGKPVAQVAGALLIVLSALTLFEYVGHWNFGIDELFGRDILPKQGTSHPGRMAPETAWTFYFFGFSLFFLPSRSERIYWLGQVLLLASVSIGVYQGMTYYFEVRNAAFTHTRMALHTSYGVILAGLGLFCAFPERGLVGILHRQTAGGLLARRFLPWGFVIPLLMWWVHILSQNHQLVSEEQGFALFFTLTFVFLMALITSTALQLHAMDSQQKETTALFDSVIENIPNMIFLKDAEGLRFRLFNRAGEALLGYPRTALLGKNDYDLFPKEQADFFTEKDREILKQSEPVDIPEEPIATKTGQRILHTKKITVKNDLGRPLYLLGISEDITQRKQHESQLEEQRKLLIQTSKMSALGEMASGIAHEINNPLSVVYGEAEDLRELATLEELNFEEVARIATKIEATTERIARIIKGLRTFARDSSEELVVPTNLKQVVDDTLLFCHERFVTHGTMLSVAPIPNTLEIECRRIQLSQVLLNLLNNAFDALQGQKDPRITVEWRDLGEDLEISVVDNGPGIPEKIRDKIFQPFFSTKEVGRGTGLGLSIAKGIVEAHRGTLTAENGASRGAIFKIRIPRVQKAEMHSAESAA